MQELARRQGLQEYKEDLEEQLQQERALAVEEKERLMESMWAEKQTLLRAMANLQVDWSYVTSVSGLELQCARP